MRDNERLFKREQMALIQACMCAQVEMARLGAEGVTETPQVPDMSGMKMVCAPEGEAAVGGRVSVHFASVGIWCRGEVLAYDASQEVAAQPLLICTEARLPSANAQWVCSGCVR